MASGDITAVDEPSRDISVHPNTSLIAIEKESEEAPVFLRTKVNVVCIPGSVVLSAGDANSAT